MKQFRDGHLLNLECFCFSSFFVHLVHLSLRFASFADVSCVVGCPYEGFIAPKAVAMVRLNIVQRHLAMIILFITL